MAASGRTFVLCVVGLLGLWLGSASSEPTPNGVLVRKGEGSPWGNYFSPGFGGYYSADDFRIEPLAVHAPAAVQVPYETYEMNQGDEQQLIQGPDFSQATQGPDYGQVTQGPDLSQVTQGPDLGQETQGPDLEQVTQGPDLGQVTERPSVQQTQGPMVPDYQVTTYRPEVPDAQSTNDPDDQQFTTEPSVQWPSTGYPTTTDFPEPTTWRPHITHHHTGGCQANPAASGYPRGTKLLCTVELCGGGGHGVKGGGIKGIKSVGRAGLATTLVCRPHRGCDDVTIQTTMEPEYTTTAIEHTTHYPTSPDVTTESFQTTRMEEITTHTPDFGIKGGVLGVKGGHHQHHLLSNLGVKGDHQMGIKGDHHMGIKGDHHIGIKGDHHMGIKGNHQTGIKGALSQQTWEVETLTQSPELEGIKGVKGGRWSPVSVNIPAYSGFRGQWNRGTHSDRQTGVKGFDPRPPMGLKGYRYEVKGLGGSAQSGWGHHGYL